MKRLTIILGIALALALTASPAQAAPSDFGLESVGAALSTTQAGAHPDFTVDFTLKTDPASSVDSTGLHEPYARLRDVSVSLPPGLLGNPNSVESCTVAQFATAFNGGGCPNASQVGIAELSIYNLKFRYVEPIYNMEPPGEGDVVARLAFYAANLPVYINVEVRSESDYGITAKVEGANATEEVVAAKTTLWGVPAAPVHDTQRQTPREAFNGVVSSPARPPDRPPAPFMVNPTSCGSSQPVSVAVDSYQEPERISTMSAQLPAISGCGLVEFDPSLTVVPTSREAAAPTGLEAELAMPQNETVGGRATSHLKDATVVLPEGMTIAAGAADGLQACSAAEVGFRIAPPKRANCPEAAKIGSAEIDVPALSRVIQGAVYQRTPEPGNLFRIWLVADELGLHLKLPGEIRLNPATGQITSLFLDTPQAPVRSFKLHFFGGPRAPLATPSTCGTYQTAYTFAPWSGRPAKSGTTPMTIDANCNTGGFAPGLNAGATNPVAGAFSSLAVDVTRNASEQNIAGLQVTLPPGALAKVAGVPLCPESAAATAACPASSQIGTTTVASGPGPAPLWIPQPGKERTAVYLAGPYKSAPYSILVKTPAQAGPFDLGTVVVRAALQIDPQSAQVTTISDPLPQILEGVPVTYRTIHVDVDRPDFAINPTSCKPKAVSAQITSIGGAQASPQSRYQVGSCASLGFEPKLAFKLTGKTKRGGYPALKATLTPRKGDANFAKVITALPHSAFLAQEHIRTICTRVQFAAETCPQGSIYGRARATSPLLDYAVEGPVYLRSSSNPLPDLVIALKGPAQTPVKVVLVGRIDSVNGGIRATFTGTPDVPVSKFVLNMQGGKKGLLVNSRNLCKSTNRASVTLDAQNGRQAELEPALVASGCGSKKK